MGLAIDNYKVRQPVIHRVKILMYQADEKYWIKHFY